MRRLYSNLPTNQLSNTFNHQGVRNTSDVIQKVRESDKNQKMKTIQDVDKLIADNMCNHVISKISDFLNH